MFTTFNGNRGKLCFVCVFVNVGQTAEGEEKTLREEKGTRQTVKLEGRFGVNVLSMFTICPVHSVPLLTILFCIKCVHSLSNPVGDESFIQFNWDKRLNQQGCSRPFQLAEQRSEVSQYPAPWSVQLVTFELPLAKLVTQQDFASGKSKVTNCTCQGKEPGDPRPF